MPYASRVPRWCSSKMPTAPQIDRGQRGHHRGGRASQELQRAKDLAEARNAELEAAKARIETKALHDTLTGLPNRRYLDEMLAERSRRTPRRRAWRWPSSISISTASSRSTTRLATRPATPC